MKMSGWYWKCKYSPEIWKGIRDVYSFYILSGLCEQGITQGAKKTLELIEGAMVGVNERLKKTGYFVPSKVEEKEGCFYFFPHFCRLRSRSTLLYPHLIIVSPVFFYFSIYIRMYIKKVRVTIFHLLSSNQEMKRSFPSYYRQKAPSE